jgi:peptidoglycan/LPS O-acetylase OafA/YrhL
MLWLTCGERTGVKGFLALDGLRGYMAWWVVIGHALHLSGLQDVAPAFLTGGDHAVNVFVCLSGFVISHLLLERQEAYGPYLTRRAFRIFPIYWFALACALVLSQMYDFVYAGDWVFQHEMRAARAAVTDAGFAKYLLLHVGLLHGLVPDTWLPYSSTAFLAPAWSLTLEWQFYLVAPLIVAGLATRGRTRLLTLLLLSAVWIMFKKVIPLQWQYPAVLPLSLHFFMLGILSRVFLPVLARAGNWVLPVGLISAATLAPYSVRVEFAIWIVFLAASCAQLRVAQKGGETEAPYIRVLRLVTSNRAARWLGEFSYSTYLIHISLFSLVGWIAAQLFGAWTQSVSIASTLLAVALLVPLSAALYRLVEQPCIRLGAELARPRSTALKAG